MGTNHVDQPAPDGVRLGIERSRAQMAAAARELIEDVEAPLRDGYGRSAVATRTIDAAMKCITALARTVHDELTPALNGVEYDRQCAENGLTSGE